MAESATWKRLKARTNAHAYACALTHMQAASHTITNMHKSMRAHTNTQVIIQDCGVCQAHNKKNTAAEPQGLVLSQQTVSTNGDKAGDTLSVNQSSITPRVWL